jgi:pimeloyl-ACP methyl ester carboxylesterase
VPQVRSSGTTIDYDDAGLGDPALLLMPGWCATRAAWAPVIDGLSAHRRVFALDWRGHGGSGPPPGDLGVEDLVDDAGAVIADSGAPSVLPVGLAHAGWVGIELRRRLSHMITGLVVVDWIVSSVPAGFLTALEGLRSEADRDGAIDGMLQLWQAGVTEPDLAAFLADLATAPCEMWERAAREIQDSYARHGSPLRALSQLRPPLPVLHLLPVSGESCSLEREKAYAAEHSWYHAVELPAHSHFPLFEAPGPMAEEIELFAKRVGGRRSLRRAA